MSYLGDLLPGATLDFLFNTLNASGTPTGVTVAGIVVSVYKEGNTSEVTTGVTTTANFDGRVGMHRCQVVMTDAFYAAGADYSLVITLGQVSGGGQLVGYVLHQFSLANRVPNLAQAEPAQGAPPVSASPMDKLAYLYKAWRNKKTQTATQWSLFGDDTTTVHHKATVSDDGTTATKGEIATGP